MSKLSDAHCTSNKKIYIYRPVLFFLNPARTKELKYFFKIRAQSLKLVNTSKTFYSSKYSNATVQV